MKLEPGTDRGSSATVSTSAECASSDGRTDRRNVSRQPLEPKSRPCSLVGSIGYLRSTTAVRGRERLSVLPTPFSLGLPPLLSSSPPPENIREKVGINWRNPPPLETERFRVGLPREMTAAARGSLLGNFTFEGDSLPEFSEFDSPSEVLTYRIER